MSTAAKPLVWLTGTLVTPPVGREARREAGYLLRLLQLGESLGMPQSRPMPEVGRRVHELRVKDAGTSSTWRIFYRLDPDVILVPHWFAKKDEKTPKGEIAVCQGRLSAYDQAVAAAAKAMSKGKKVTRRKT